VCLVDGLHKEMSTLAFLIAKFCKCFETGTQLLLVTNRKSHYFVVMSGFLLGLIGSLRIGFVLHCICIV